MRLSLALPLLFLATLAQSAPTVAAGGDVATPPALAALADLHLDSLDGAPTTLGAQWTPGRPVVVALWATWCAPCLREMEIFDELVRELGSDRLTVIGINVDRWPEREAEVRAVLRKQQPAYPQWRGDASTWQALTGESLPLRLPRVRVHDREGNLVLYSTRMNFGTPAELRRTIRDLAREPSGQR